MANVVDVYRKEGKTSEEIDAMISFKREIVDLFSPQPLVRVMQSNREAVHDWLQLV